MRTKLIFWLAVVMLALVPALAGCTGTHGQDPRPRARPGQCPHRERPGGPQHGRQDRRFTPLPPTQNGDYKGEGIKPGTYYITLLSPTPGKAVDRFDNVKFTPATDTLQDFDLSRAEYVNKLPPEQQKALEEAKAKNAEINKENQNVGKLNDLLKQARADNQPRSMTTRPR